jgi:DNA-binding transcriptional MocR family regulator
LGTHLLEKDKKRLIQLADQYDICLIEDDYLADLTGNPKNLPLHFYDTNERVIYVKSFSKAFLPGIRLGMAVMPRKLLKDYIALKRVHDLNTEVLNQGALAIFLESGLYDRHVAKCRSVYQRKSAIAQQILRKITHPEVKVGSFESSFLVCITFGEGFPYSLLMAMLEEKELLVTQDEGFFLNHLSEYRLIRLCLASLPEEQLRKGLSLLVSSIQQVDKGIGN